MRFRLLAMLVVIQFLAACAPRRPPRFPLPQQVTLYLAVSDQAAQSDNGNVASMIEALEADLKDAGYLVQLVTAHPSEPPPVPRVEIQVRNAKAADQQRLGTAQLIGGPLLTIGANGSLLVDTFVVAQGKPPAYAGRTESSSIMAMTEDAQTAAGERAGHAIARNLLASE